MGLTLYDLNDRELLWRLDDVADDEGGATAAEVAEALGLRDVTNIHVAQRFSWLKRYGALDTRDGERMNEEGRLVKAKVWFLTDVGHRYVFSQMNRRQRTSIEGLDESVLLEVTSILTDRYEYLDPTARTLMRRQFRSRMEKSPIVLVTSTEKRRNGRKK